MSRALTRIAVVSAALLIAGCGTHGSSQGSNITIARDNGPTGPEIDGNGKAGTEKREIPDFRKIRTDGIADITIRMGKSPGVAVTGDSNLLTSIVTHSQDGLLTISEQGNIHPKLPLRIDVTAPSLEHVTTDGTDAIHFKDIKAKRLGIDINGTGGVDGSGKADVLSLDISGTGSARLVGLLSLQTDVSISGTGDASVTAIQAINARVSGTGHVVYGGNPHVVTTKVSGTGSVISGTGMVSGG